MKTKKKSRSRTSLTREADRLVSLKVRARGHCELWLLKPELRCEGPLQACHVLSRRYRATRWLEENLLAGCRAHHVYFTHRPEAFYIAVEAVYPGLWVRLWEIAQTPWDRDIEGVLAGLKASDEVWWSGEPT